LWIGWLILSIGTGGGTMQAFLLNSYGFLFGFTVGFAVGGLICCF
jgi:hypothetical protein